MIICTICGANHLAKAACMMNSFRRTQPIHDSVVCLVERERTALAGFESYFSNNVLAEEIGIPGFSQFMFRHTLYEACCALKAQFLLWVMASYPNETQFLFLDPDTYVYSRFEELESILSDSDIVVTPHHIHDEESLDGVWDNMLRTMVCGIYNAGFLALRRSTAALDFLRWWSRKVQMLCYIDSSIGLFCDQKWIDMSFSFFDITIFREPGYNVANWNISRRNLTYSDKSATYFVGNKPLRFVHFSMIDSGRDMFYFKKYLSDDHPIFQMRAEYLGEVEAIDPGGGASIEWSYDRFTSGELITDHTRRLFRRGSKLGNRFPDPFGASNAALSSAAARPIAAA